MPSFLNAQSRRAVASRYGKGSEGRYAMLEMLRGGRGRGKSSSDTPPVRGGRTSGNGSGKGG